MSSKFLDATTCRFLYDGFLQRLRLAGTSGRVGAGADSAVILFRSKLGHRKGSQAFKFSIFIRALVSKRRGLAHTWLQRGKSTSISWTLPGLVDLDQLSYLKIICNSL